MKLRKQDIEFTMEVLHTIDQYVPHLDEWKVAHPWLKMLLGALLHGDTDDEGFVELQVKGWEKIYGRK